MGSFSGRAAEGRARLSVEGRGAEARVARIQATAPGERPPRRPFSSPIHRGLAEGARQSGKEFSLRAGGLGSMQPFGLWSDGETVLATDWLGGTVRGYALSGGARRSGHDIDGEATANGYAAGLWSDGETLWVVDETEQQAYAYAAPGLEQPATQSGSLLQELASRAGRRPGRRC